jgi:PIN domain nuclease of toxin-antitoxin system
VKDGARLLLDTHALLWALIDPEQLRTDAREKIEDGSNDVYVSAATAWEIEIKRVLGKLEAPDDLEEQLRAARMVELPVRIIHAAALRRLPALHRDPFDRLLIAQAQVEQLTIVTRDGNFSGYGVPLLPA